MRLNLPISDHVSQVSDFKNPPISKNLIRGIILRDVLLSVLPFKLPH